jgi:hypothetical protein
MIMYVFAARNRRPCKDLWPNVKLSQFPGIICAQISDFWDFDAGRAYSPGFLAAADSAGQVCRLLDCKLERGVWMDPATGPGAS